MTVLSKFCADTLGFTILPSNCYETVHTWEPDCNKAIQAAVGNGFRFSLKTYATVYVLTHLFSAKGDPRKVKWKNVLINTLQSSTFLTTNLILYLWFLCRTRHAMGFFIWPMLGLVNGMLASFFAILLEKSSRRPALAVYLTNLASETLFRQAANHGYVKKIPNGEWIPFAIGLGIMFLLKSTKRLDKSLEKILSITHRTGNEEIISDKTIRKAPEDFQKLIQDLRENYAKTQECEHKHSCVATSVESFGKNFATGLGISSVLVLLKNLRNVFKAPTKVAKALCSTDNLKLPLFFGLLPFIYHSTNCLMNRLTPGYKIPKQVTSGLISGVSMRFFPNVTIAMYFFSKSIEALYTSLANDGHLPWVKYGDIIMYTISTGYVLFAASIEPQAVRAGYFKFLMGLTGDRLALFNRTTWDVMGFNTSRNFRHFHPKLDPKFITLNPMHYQPMRLD